MRVPLGQLVAHDVGAIAGVDQHPVRADDAARERLVSPHARVDRLEKLAPDLRVLDIVLGAAADDAVLKTPRQHLSRFGFNAPGDELNAQVVGVRVDARGHQHGAAVELAEVVLAAGAQAVRRALHPAGAQPVHFVGPPLAEPLVVPELVRRPGVVDARATVRGRALLDDGPERAPQVRGARNVERAIGVVGVVVDVLAGTDRALAVALGPDSAARLARHRRGLPQPEPVFVLVELHS